MLRSSMVGTWRRWQDWCNLILGIILFISPWFLVTAGFVHSSWNSWILGVLIFLVSLWALNMPASPAPEWINLILGIWVFITPWILGYAMVRDSWAAWIIGALVVILSVWTLAQMRSHSEVRV